jgi:hypothetical protein
MECNRLTLVLRIQPKLKQRPVPVSHFEPARNSASFPSNIHVHGSNNHPTSECVTGDPKNLSLPGDPGTRHITCVQCPWNQETQGHATLRVCSTPGTRRSRDTPHYVCAVPQEPKSLISKSQKDPMRMRKNELHDKILPKNMAMAHFSICLSISYHPMSKAWMWCRQGPWRSHMALYVATGSQYEDVLAEHTDRWTGFLLGKRVKLSRQLIRLHANRTSALDGTDTWQTVIFGALLVRVRCVAVTFFDLSLVLDELLSIKMF